MDNRLVIKKVAHNWQDWPSGKNYKTPSGPSLLTASARNSIQSVLTRPANYYFQQSIFSYSKITAVYLFIYFCLFFFTFLVLLTAVMLILFSLTSHTDFSKLSPSLSMLLFLLTFNRENCTYRPRNDPQSGNEPQMEAKNAKWFRSRDEPLFYFSRADPEKIPI